MANVDKPFGGRPHIHQGGSEPPVNPYPILATYATAMAKGDPVLITSDGVAQLAGAGGTTIVGFAKCFTWTDATTGKAKRGDYKPASVAGYVYVYDDPATVFEIQAVTGVTAAQTHAGNNGDLTTTACSAVGQGGHSNVELNTPGTGAATCRVLGLAPIVGNAWGEHAVLLVRILEHFNAPITADVTAATPVAGI